MRALCNCYQQSLSCVHCLLAAPAVAASFAPRQASGHPPHELLKTTPTLARRLLLVALQDLRGPLPELRLRQHLVGIEVILFTQTISHYRTMASSACQTKATGYMLFPSTPRRHALAQACHSAQTRTGQAWNHAALHTPRADSTTGTLMKTPQKTRPRRERGIRFRTFLLGLKEAV